MGSLDQIQLPPCQRRLYARFRVLSDCCLMSWPGGHALSVEQADAARQRGKRIAEDTLRLLSSCRICLFTACGTLLGGLLREEPRV